MNRYDLEVYTYRTYGQTIGWMANVINTSHSNPATKIQGLLYLAYHDMVAPMSFSMDSILIDGYAKPWSALEDYAKRYQAEPERMRMHISQVPCRTAFTLSEVKMLCDTYHNTIQAAARVLVEAGLGEMVYYTSYASGSSAWRHEDSQVATVVVTASGEIKR